MDERTDKLNTKKDPGQQLADHCDNSENKLTEEPDTSRRKFTRNMLVGSAVLLTLNNRSAWGAPPALNCISTNLLVSYDTGQPSALTGEQQTEIENWKTIRDNYDGDDDVDKSTSYRTGDVSEVETDTCYLYKPK